MPAPDLETLFARHFGRVWRTLRRLGVPEAQAEDAAQDVFLVVHRRLHEFRSEATIETWLYGIAIRVARDHRRALARHHRRVEEAAVHPPEPPHGQAAVERRDAARIVNLLLDRLTGDEREILVLVELEQRSVKEVAATLGLNVNTAHTRLRSARAAFNRELVRFQKQAERRAS